MQPNVVLMQRFRYLAKDGSNKYVTPCETLE